MKKTFLLVVIAILTAGLANAQTAWVTQRINNKVSVKFPNTPKITAQGYYFAAEKDSSSRYIAFMLDAPQVLQIDSAEVLKEAPNADFAAQFKTGMESTMTNVKLGDVTIGQWHGFPCYHINGSDPKQHRYDLFVFFTGDKMYGFVTYSSNPAVLTGRDKFYASVAYTSK
jgi:hypothetical protein